MKRSIWVELFWKIHVPIYRMTGGRVLGRLVGMPVLLLTTLGRRSGEPRTTALTYVEVGDAFLVVGSFLGEPRHPAWVHNLRSRPEARIQIGSDTLSVHAREAEGDERSALWKTVIAANADYADYEHRTDRVIPLVLLEPGRDDDGSSQKTRS